MDAPRLAVVMNRRAGGATRRLVDAVRRADVELHVTDDADAAERVLAALVERGVTRIVLGGGDGTAVAGLAAIDRACAPARATAPVVGVLALGTGNALARTIGARRPRASAVGAALARAATAAPVTVPMLDVLGRRAPFCGFGVDAQLVADADQVARRLARLRLPVAPVVRYALSVPLVSMPAFVSRVRPVVTIDNRGAAAHPDGTAAASGVLWTGACTLAACATIPYFGFGLRMFAFADAMPGRFQVRAGDAGLGEIVTSAPAAFRGRYLSPHVHDFLCTAVTLRLDRPAPFEIAGDVVGTYASVDVALGMPAQLVAV